jgi:hypothetical protein
MTARESRETCEVDQPWVIYTYGATHDRWWPFWNSTRILGRAKIGMECCVCGTRRLAVMKMPRFGPVPEPEGGKHALRVAFLKAHEHPDRGHPMSWARPLRNLAMHAGGLNLDLLAMRMDVDLNEETT